MRNRRAAEIEQKPIRRKMETASADADRYVTSAGLNPQQQAMLHMQQTRGNAAVQRAVQIDEMSSNFEVRDEAKLGSGTKGVVKDAIKEMTPTGDGDNSTETDSSSSSSSENSTSEAYTPTGASDGLSPSDDTFVDEYDM